MGFGRPSLIRDLKGSVSPAETMCHIKNFETAVGTRITCIQAYGNMQIKENQRLSTLQKIHSLIPEIVCWRQQKIDGTPSLHATTSYVGQLDIPYFRSCGLIQWLLICDLVEYRFCLPPTGLDLVQKLGEVSLHHSAKAKGDSGAIGAFEQIQKETNITMVYSTSKAFGDALDWIVQCLNTERRKEIEQWMRWSWTIADVKHMLYKIAREDSRR